MRFSATEWKEFLEIGTRKIIKKKWMRKFVNDWRNKTYKQVNDEIRQQEWETM